MRGTGTPRFLAVRTTTDWGSNARAVCARVVNVLTAAHGKSRKRKPLVDERCTRTDKYNVFYKHNRGGAHA